MCDVVPGQYGRPREPRACSPTRPDSGMLMLKMSQVRTKRPGPVRRVRRLERSRFECWSVLDIETLPP